MADHEIPDLAAQLVTIPGYSYADAPATDVAQGLAALHNGEQQMDSPDFFAAASFHGVVAEDHTQNQSHTAGGGTEVGYLVLTEFRYSPPAGLGDNPTYFTQLFEKGMAAPASLTIAGTHVFKFNHPSTPDSRYFYVWIRHGVQGQFDGANDASMERWLALYLDVPALAPDETAPLAKHLVAVTGFVYVNAPALTDLDAAVVKAFGAVPRSIHKVADSSGAIGTLSLVELSSPVSPDEAASAVFAAMGVPTGSARHQVIAGVPVSIYESGNIPVYIWVTGNTLGIFSADADATANTFVEALVQAWASTA